VRTNPFTGATEPLGIVGGGYHPLQNEEHAEFLNHLADVSGATFDTAGSLRGGRQVFVTMRLPEHLSIGGTDRVDLNIAALNSHDGSSAFRVLVTPVRVVCANTQHAALRNHLSSWSIRHTRNAKAAVQAARDTLGLTFAYVEAFEAEAERMINTSVTDAAFFELVQNLFPSPTPDAPARTRNAGQAPPSEPGPPVARRRHPVRHRRHRVGGLPERRRSTSTTSPRSATRRRRHGSRAAPAHHRRARPDQGSGVDRTHPGLIPPTPRGDRS
jgi:phage/plasmid-like protein (TIGR03299 family)